MQVWEAVASQLGFTSEEAMWRKLYAEDSLAAIAAKFHVSPGQIRGRIEACGIPLRSRGGANYQKVEMSKELLDDVTSMGIRKAALKHGVQPQTLYNRIYYRYGLTIGDLRRQAEAEVAKERANAKLAAAEVQTEEDPKSPA